MLVGITVTVREATNVQAELYTKLESSFGFTSEIVTMDNGENGSKVVVIHPRENGKFYEAGFRDGDQLLSYSKYKFYSLLHEKKGDSIPIDVVDINGTAKSIILNIPN